MRRRRGQRWRKAATIAWLAPGSTNRTTWSCQHPLGAHRCRQRTSDPMCRLGWDRHVFLSDVADTLNVLLHGLRYIKDIRERCRGHVRMATTVCVMAIVDHVLDRGSSGCLVGGWVGQGKNTHLTFLGDRTLHCLHSRNTPPTQGGRSKAVLKQ